METKIYIKDILSDSDWMETEEGFLVYGKIEPLLQAGDVVDLSFAGATLVLTPFMNSAIGQLYGKFDQAFINEHLKLTDCDPKLDIEDKFSRVSLNAIRYYQAQSKERCDSVVQQETES